MHTDPAADSSATPPARSLQRWAQISALLLTLISLSWVVWLLFDSLAAQGWQLLLPQRLDWLLSSFVLLMLVTLCNSVLFYHCLAANQSTPISFPLTVKLFCVGQVVRYLPGRVWSVLYQISAAREQLSAATITRANLDLMLFALFGHISAVALILGVTGSLSAGWAAAIFISAVLMLSSALLGGLRRLLRIFAALLPNRLAKLRNFSLTLAESTISPRRLAWMTLAFICNWLLFLAAWSALGHAFSNLQNVDMVVLCAWYIVAWIVGFVSALTPAGLGIREAAFVFAASHSADQAMLAFIALTVRVWIMLSDVLLVVLLMPVWQQLNTRK